MIKLITIWHIIYALVAVALFCLAMGLIVPDDEVGFMWLNGFGVSVALIPYFMLAYYVAKLMLFTYKLIAKKVKTLNFARGLDTDNGGGN
ncbi:hypothetical protein [Campylobacter sp. MG1]|uniref:hypothetical protein n=1 Tax=Campylobacter sp. MG1 TaxID=2976332 RepID=UPI00226D2992|nr:hypothetical protein [Campylobacter sp. MG1]